MPGLYGLFPCAPWALFIPTLPTLSFGSLLKNCNHKGLGIYYLLSAFIFGISGTLISVLIRIELYSSGNRIISPENQNFYNINITLHGFLMIFFLLILYWYVQEWMKIIWKIRIYYLLILLNNYRRRVLSVRVWQSCAIVVFNITMRVSSHIQTSGFQKLLIDQL